MAKHLIFIALVMLKERDEALRYAFLPCNVCGRQESNHDLCFMCSAQWFEWGTAVLRRGLCISKVTISV